MTMRGTPLSRYITDSSRQRRSPCRIPACPPNTVNGIETTEISAAVSRLSRRSTALSTGVNTSRTRPSPMAAR